MQPAAAGRTGERDPNTTPPDVQPVTGKHGPRAGFESERGRVRITNSVPRVDGRIRAQDNAS